LHEGHLVFLGDRGIDQHIGARIRAKQEIDLVAGQQLGIELHAQIGVGLVVENRELEGVILAVDRDAALGVDLVDRKLIGVPVVAAGICHPCRSAAPRCRA